MTLVYGQSRAVAEWVAAQMPHIMDPPADCAAIGVARDGVLIAGVVYHNYFPAYAGIEMSIAATSPRWATRGVIRELLAYPFVQLGCRWVVASVEHSNTRALRFNKGIGFVQRGILPDFYAPKRHCVLMSLPARGFARLFKKAG